MQLIKFPSIDQFRTVVKHVRDRAQWHKVPLPKLKFNGSVKLHGTNAAIVRDVSTGEIWTQSREQIITPEKDNAGFAKFVDSKDCINLLFNIAAGVYGFHKLNPGDQIAIYGEWCGSGIMKGVAITQLSKRFVIFGIRVWRGEESSIWFTPEQLIDVIDGFGREASEEEQIFCIQKYQTWEVEIDFSQPEQIQNYLGELTKGVEACCPFGKAFGVEGVGEGIVWRCIGDWLVDSADGTSAKIQCNDLIFKVKGAKHSDTKVTKLAEVDIEKVNSIKELASNVTTDHRLEKMVQLMREDNVAIEAQSIPIFLKLVGQDVQKEEGDRLDASGFTRKEIMHVVNANARQWFLTMVNSSL